MNVFLENTDFLHLESANVKENLLNIRYFRGGRLQFVSGRNQAAVSGGRDVRVDLSVDNWNNEGSVLSG